MATEDAAIVKTQAPPTSNLTRRPVRRLGRAGTLFMDRFLPDVVRRSIDQHQDNTYDV
jgi:hypothetical protein